jgi:LDH2 family malate/lactate/ureidoglycolate dehydrogenase
LSLACELLGGALTGGKTQTGPKSREAIINSMFSVLVSPQKLGTLESFLSETSAFVRWAQSEAGAPHTIRQGSEALQRISAALSPADIEKAQADARAWKAVP